MSNPPTPLPNNPGAVGINALWELALAPRPLVQEQGEGGDALLTQSGYAPVAGHLAAAESAWTKIDWMQAYLVNGEFPGNGNPTPGNNFFDMMNALASFTRGARAIAQSAVWDARYHAKVLEEAGVWDGVCQWLLTPAVKTVGDAYNTPNTHRRWMSATVLRNTAWLLRLAGGTTNLAHADAYDTAALAYESDGLAQQMGPGWMLALYPPKADGSFRESRLYLPPDAPPAYFDGTASSAQIYGEGVRPEQGDTYVNRTWDAIYNPNGDKLAVWGVAVQNAGAHREACARAVDVNLFCAMQFLTAARDGAGAPIMITPNGSCRVGTSSINGTRKVIDPKAWRDIYRVQAGLAPDAATYGGSSDPAARAVFAQVFHWLDNILRSPSATIPDPPAIPASLYPTVTAPAGTVTKTLRATGPGGTVTKQVTITQG